MIKITPHNPSNYLKDPKFAHIYLNTLFEDSETTPSEIIQALGDIAKAQGITDISRKTGLSRESIYKSLSGKTNPRFDTIFKIIKALGLSITVTNYI